jgi:hypothetical protein
MIPNFTLLPEFWASWTFNHNPLSCQNSNNELWRNALVFKQKNGQTTDVQQTVF